MDNAHNDNFPVLETERLLLRELRETDAAMLHQYWSDPVVTEYFTQEPFARLEESLDMVRLLHGLFAARQGIRWAICDKTNGQVLGTCGFHNVKPEHLRAEIGYELGREYWRQGIMSEALRAIMFYGFETLKLNRIEAFVTYGNERSAGILTKLGFNRDGLLRNYEFGRGRYLDLYCFSLLASDTSKA